MKQRHPLDDARQKIDRAEAKIPELVNALVRHCTVGAVYDCVTEFDPALGQNAVKMHLRGPVPGEVAMIVGEVFQGLRTALDYLAVELAKRNGVKVTTRVSFPFAKSQAEFEDPDFQKKLRAFAPGAAAAIEALKPYRGGTDLLWALHDANNIDKHRNLLVVSLRTTETSIRVVPTPHDSACTTTGSASSFRAILSDKEIGAPAFVSDPATKPQIRTTFAITFGDVDVLHGRAVLTTLKELVEVTRGIVESFAAQHFA